MEDDVSSNTVASNKNKLRLMNRGKIFCLKNFVQELIFMFAGQVAFIHI